MFGRKKKKQENNIGEEQISLTPEELDSLEFSEDSSEISLGQLEEEIVEDNLEFPIEPENIETEELEQPEEELEQVHPIVQYYSDLEKAIYKLESDVNEILIYLNKEGKKKK